MAGCGSSKYYFYSYFLGSSGERFKITSCLVKEKKHIEYSVSVVSL